MRISMASLELKSDSNLYVGIAEINIIFSEQTGFFEKTMQKTKEVCQCRKAGQRCSP
jgi:hypothetical protein